jgi:hypothetical protein
MNEISDLILKQNRLIISLLGRLAFPDDKLTSAITRNSKKPETMIKAYNLCTGALTTNQISKKLKGITNRALNQATLKWEENGILLNLGERGKGKDVIPLHLYKLESEGSNG